LTKALVRVWWWCGRRLRGATLDWDAWEQTAARLMLSVQVDDSCQAFVNRWGSHPCRPAAAPRSRSFDKTFCETAPQLEQDYAVPSVFPDDLFALLGASRPDWRWLIIGPLRSGSRYVFAGGWRTERGLMLHILPATIT
jgi:hypothetical protein